MRQLVREKKYFCKDYLDIDIFQVAETKKSPKRRAAKMKPSSEIQEKINESNAHAKLSRLIHTNFTDEDYKVGLDYNSDCLPENEEQVKRDLQNFFRRLKRRRKRLGLPDLKYIAVSGYGKKSGRAHHHLIINGGISREEVECLWDKGRANTERLQFTLTGCADIAEYYIRHNDTAALFGKRWNASKNLERPVEKQNHETRSGEFAELCRDCNNWKAWEKRYPGYAVSEDPFVYTSDSGYTYLSVRLYKTDSDYIQIAGQSKKQKALRRQRS